MVEITADSLFYVRNYLCIKRSIERGIPDWMVNTISDETHCNMTNGSFR